MFQQEMQKNSPEEKVYSRRHGDRQKAATETIMEENKRRKQNCDWVPVWKQKYTHLPSLCMSFLKKKIISQIYFSVIRLNRTMILLLIERVFEHISVWVSQNEVTVTKFLEKNLFWQNSLWPIGTSWARQVCLVDYQLYHAGSPIYLTNTSVISQ